MSKLEAVSITKSFGDNTILQDVSLRLEPREIVCLLGVSGGGKTTLFNVLSGLTLPDRGQVFLDGREITGKAGHISYMLQKDLLMPYRTVLDNIALPLIIKGAPKKEARRKALEHFAEFGLSGTEKQYPAQLSGGMRREGRPSENLSLQRGSRSVRRALQRSGRSHQSLYSPLVSGGHGADRAIHPVYYP